MKKRLIVSALIFKDDLLVIGRKEPGRGPYPDTWHIPGGGVDEDENLDEALIREVKEETNLDVTDLEKVSFDTAIIPNHDGIETYYVFLQYRCQYKGGELEPLDDLKELMWMPIKDAMKYELNAPTLVLLKKLGYL